MPRKSKKPSAYDPCVWSPSGTCRLCFRLLEARYNGNEVRHKELTACPLYPSTKDVCYLPQAAGRRREK